MNMTNEKEVCSHIPLKCSTASLKEVCVQSWVTLAEMYPLLQITIEA